MLCYLNDQGAKAEQSLGPAGFENRAGARFHASAPFQQTVSGKLQHKKLDFTTSSYKYDTREGSKNQESRQEQ